MKADTKLYVFTPKIVHLRIHISRSKVIHIITAEPSKSLCLDLHITTATTTTIVVVIVMRRMSARMGMSSKISLLQCTNISKNLIEKTKERNRSCENVANLPKEREGQYATWPLGFSSTSFFLFFNSSHNNLFLPHLFSSSPPLQRSACLKLKNSNFVSPTHSSKNQRNCVFGFFYFN